MRRMWRVVLALVVAGPGPVFAQTIGRPAPATPAAGRLSGVSVPLAPALGPAGIAPLAASALSPSALTAPSAAPIPAAAPLPAAQAAETGLPRSAYEGLRTEYDAPAPDVSDFEGGRDHAARSFEKKLGLDSSPSDPVAAVVDAFTEGSFHALARVQTPPAAPGDDGGGPTKARPVKFYGETFRSVNFRPNEPADKEIARAIDTSRKSIRINIYEFTSRSILKALLAAKKRGVKVQVVLCDSSVNPQSKPGDSYRRYRSEQIWSLIRNGVDVQVLGRPTEYGIDHHKVAVFDDKMVAYGSYNWTYTSEQNHYENLLFSVERDRVAAYLAAWKAMRRLSVPVEDSLNREWPLETPKLPSDAKKRVRFNGIRLPAWIFTPDELFEDSIAAAIGASKSSVDVAAFVLQSRKIADALGRAIERGVKVRIVADRSQSEYEHVQLFLGWLQRKGAQVRTLSGPNGEHSDYPLAEKMHNKYFIFDSKLVETGSANATKNASANNFENANFLNDKTDVAAFVKTFEHMFSVAKEAPLYPEGELPTDEQMRENVLRPRGPPEPAAPPHEPLPAAGRLSFNGVDFPKSALRPHEPAEVEIIKSIDVARKRLRIAMYEFNSQGIWDALQRAKKRGIKIEVVLDRGHVYTSGTEDDGVTPRMPKPMIRALLKDGGFNVLLLKGRLGGIMHHKFVVADGDADESGRVDGLVQFGSQNYTPQSETDHYENVMIRTEAARVQAYAREFDHMRTLSEAPDLDKVEMVISRTESALPQGVDFGFETEGEFPVEIHAPESTPLEFNGERFALQMFSPNGGIEEAILRAIGAARTSIQIAMFSFFSQPIAEALLRAKENGVHVQIVMDRSQTGTSKLDEWFAWHGFDLSVSPGPDRTRDPRYQKMHHKFAIFDGKMLSSGSFNFSSRAEKLSYENANFFDEADEIARFAAAFLQMFQRGAPPRAPKRQPTFVAPPAAV